VSHLEGIDLVLSPPGGFIPAEVKFAVMDTAERYGEFIAHLAPHGARLCEAEMVRIRRASSADQAGLRGDEGPMILVSFAPGLAKGQLDAARGRTTILPPRQQGWEH
jgi:hypothetical protein